MVLKRLLDGISFNSVQKLFVLPGFAWKKKKKLKHTRTQSSSPFSMVETKSEEVEQKGRSHHLVFKKGTAVTWPREKMHLKLESYIQTTVPETFTAYTGKFSYKIRFRVNLKQIAAEFDDGTTQC